MTEPRFDELINLYLDNEIGRSDLGELKQVIKENLVRRRKFERACELHQAARKALAASGSNSSNEASSSGDARSASRGGQSSSGRKAGPTRPNVSPHSKQSQARRNASVGVLAERQKKQGAASRVELSSINLESRASRPLDLGASGPHIFAFFDSPFGVAMGLILLIGGVAGMFFLIHAAAPFTEEDPGKFAPQSSISQLDGGYDPKAAEELAAEVKKHNATTVAADALRARVYQSALTGQEDGNASTVDYFSSHLDPASTGSTSGNPTSSAPPPTDSTAPMAPAKPDGTSAPSVTQP